MKQIKTKHTTSSIAKNTFFLYVRMLFTMFVSLFTSRIILNALGFEDYGIYNVVGGFVTMFNVFCAGLSTTTQRFLNYNLGVGDSKKLQLIFSSCVHIYIIISILIIILSEIAGIWFLENQMSIPFDRIYAAKWVFQFALFSLILNLISVPYNALIIAHEEMKAFAYISIYESIAKLFIAYLIYMSPFDKLILYAFLLFVVQASVRFIYTFYCKKRFSEAEITYKINIKNLKEIYSFAGWAMFGGLASIGFTQGLNVLLNIFFNPTVNAARGIAVQVQQTVNSFVLNFQTAINPRIIKAYAKNDIKYMYKLVFASSKFSFLLLFALATPILIEAHQILILWLKNVPEYTIVFLRLIMCTTLIDAMANPFMRTADATGQIKIYQLVIGLLLLSILPISYIVLRMSYPPYSVFYVHIFVCILAFFARLIIVKKIISFSIKEYINKVLIKVLLVGLFSFMIQMLVKEYLDESFVRIIIIVIVSLASTLLLTLFFALSKDERSYFYSKFRNICIK